MKKLILALLCIISISVQAQYMDLKGLVFQATSVYDTDDGPSKATVCNQLYEISFADNMMAHTILKDDGTIDAVQFYKITDLKRSLDDGITLFKFTCISGVSGSSYKYRVKIDANGIATIQEITETIDITFKGGTYSIRTYDQNNQMFFPWISDEKFPLVMEN